MLLGVENRSITKGTWTARSVAIGLPLAANSGTVVLSTKTYLKEGLDVDVLVETPWYKELGLTLEHVKRQKDTEILNRLHDLLGLLCLQAQSRVPIRWQ